MENSITLLFIYLAAFFLISMFGGMIPLIKKWPKNVFRLIVSFGAGVLFGSCFFHMLPRTAESLGGNVGIPILVGFFLIYFLEKFIMVHSCEEDVCDVHTIGISAFIGISFHSLLDGMSMGAGFIVKDIGFMIFMAIIIHKFPSALSLTGILVQVGYKKKKVILLTTIFALTTPIGALISFFILKDLHENVLAWAIGISTGTFLYIASSDLLPMVHQHQPMKYYNLLSLTGGLSLMWLARFYFH